jgi:long-chain acyl-CoA synthetase
VIQGYGSTENGFGTCTTPHDHGLGTVGRPMPPVELRIGDDGEILFRGPTLFKGYWRDPVATAAAIDPDGWYHTGDIGQFDRRGNLLLSGRIKNVIVLPNGLNVFPEDIENVLEQVGIAHAVVLETAPGRIEAVVLNPDSPPVISASSPAPDAPASADEELALQSRIDGLIKQANARLGQHQRIDGWRLWPEPDFPRTHTLKIKRGPVREWAGADAALPVREAEAEGA